MTGGVYDEACLTWSTEALSSLYLLDPHFFYRGLEMRWWVRLVDRQCSVVVRTDGWMIQGFSL